MHPISPVVKVYLRFCSLLRTATKPRVAYILFVDKYIYPRIEIKVYSPDDLLPGKVKNSLTVYGQGIFKSVVLQIVLIQD